MRVVIDVNVWISGLLWGGVPRRVLELVKNQQITIFVSDTLLQEMETTLRRAKLRPKMQSLGLTVDGLMSQVKNWVESCPIDSLDVPQLRDPDDTMVLATAIAANAEVIITGDLDLLILNEFEGILILTPKNFLTLYFPS
jgi:uncharacterized protein